MSIDPSFLQRSGTPLSGRSTPVQRIRNQQHEEESHSKDKAYRRYAAGVKQALASFETTQQDWADYISFLARIQKALQARPGTTVAVPYADSIATRLAQCLNPNLPSGVHQKALEVYALLLSSYEGKSLVQQLHLFLPGLTSVLSFAALSVRPYFLAILDDHLLPLGLQALRPALKALILSLLPGLEDESTEDFERVIATLDKLRQDQDVADESSSPSFFWQSFFLAAITSPSRRQGALAYLVQRLPSFITPLDFSFNKTIEADHELSTEANIALSPEPGLLVRCFAAGLTDKQLLVQRGFLDLLISHLPLHSTVLQKVIPEDDLQRLVSAATSGVLRPDMGLNRRLWQWLLGPERKEDDGIKSPTQDRTAYHAAYFSRFGLKSLTDSILMMIDAKSVDPIQRARPLRICLSLMDRWEVGGSLVPAIFRSAIQSVCEYSAIADKHDADEVVKSAGIFFDGVESALIWGKFLEMLLAAVDHESGTPQSRLDCIRLCDFIVQRFNLREEEMTELHIPLVILAFTSHVLSTNHRETSNACLTNSELASALEIVGKLASIVTKKSTGSPKPDDELDMTADGIAELPHRIKDFFKKEQQGLEVKQPISQSFILTNALSGMMDLFELILEKDTTHGSIPIQGQIICTLVQRLSLSNTPVHSKRISSLFQQVAQLPSIQLARSLPSVMAITQVSTTLHLWATEGPLDLTAWRKAQHMLINTLWEHLNPCEPKYHVEAVRCLLMLDSLTKDRSPVEAVITAHLLDAFSTEQALSAAGKIEPIEAIRRFNILWTHAQQEKSNHPDRRPSMARSISRLSINGSSSSQELLPILAQPLLVILDKYEEASKGVAAYIRDWLHVLPGQSRVYEMLITQISRLNTITQIRPSRAAHHLTISMDDSLLCLHLTRHVLSLLEDASEQTWAVLVQESMIVPGAFDTLGDDQAPTLQLVLVCMCSRLLDLPVDGAQDGLQTAILDIQETALLILQTLLRGPFAAPIRALQLETALLKRLKASIDSSHYMQQRNILRAITLALKLPRYARSDAANLKLPTSPTYGISSTPALRVETLNTMSSSRLPPPPLLIDCLKLGFSSPTSQRLVDDWVGFLVDVLPMYEETIFQNLIPLVECFCKQIKLTFVGLRDTFTRSDTVSQKTPETTLISLMTGLEQILASAHGRLVAEEEHLNATKSPEQPQGFLGSITQGVFSAEAPSKGRNVTANSRLTVILCFQDAVRTCYEVWRWDQDGSAEADNTSTASANYTSLRMRNRARRLLEHLFAAEALECLETLIVLWQDSVADGTPETCPVMPLLNVLTGASPKLTIPAIFNALYSRTNPSALEPSRLSSLTSDLSDEILIRFLISYTHSVDDDSIDEIWSDCLAFMKDVLANPLPHRQILPLLLYFLAEIASKVDNTNFGEQKKMRKELADHFLRLLAATFTTRPQGLASEEHAALPSKLVAGRPRIDMTAKQTPDALSIIAAILPQLPSILIDADRVTAAAQSISINIIAPAIKSKSFPMNAGPKYLEVLLQMTKLPQASKFWRKDIADALNDARFFLTSSALMQSYWTLIIKQFNIHEKDRLTELLGRLTPPTTAGIVFGVGATSARLDTDRKTSLVLRRIALTILSSPQDTFVSQLGAIEDKLVEIFTATPISSPSTSIWADAFLLLRVVLLKTTGIHVAPLWPFINKESQSALLSIVTDENDAESRYSNAALLQACKLLDTLIGIGSEEFQIYEWLYVTDTIDAVYRQSDSASVALADEIAEVLGSVGTAGGLSDNNTLVPTISGTAGPRRLLFDAVIDGLSNEYDMADLRSMSKQELSQRVLRPYFGQLSLLSFEATYAGQMVDAESCIGGVIADLCDGGIGGE